MAPRPPARPSTPARAGEEGRPFWMERMQIPLTGLPDSTLEQIERLGPLYEGWGREGDGTGNFKEYGAFFVDVDGRRFRGRSLRLAVKAALAGGQP